MIVTSGLIKRFKKDGRLVEALRGVDLKIEKGEFAVVRGKSGSGKSTLLNVLAGLARQSAGEVEIAGTRLDRLNGAAAAAFRARHIGIVFQMFHLIPYLDLLNNVLLPLLTPAGGASNGSAHGKERAIQLLEEFGLAARATHLPGELSAGERQRAALARALLLKPEVLLADEPTGNLDPENATAVLAHLRRFHEQGGTVLLVTHHQLPGLEGVKLRELMLEEGRLVNGQ